METKPQVSFLKEKIEEIGTALFFNLSDSVIKLPTTLISGLRVDDYEYVWFYAKKPHEEMLELETKFPARLDVFRKGMNYHMQLEGTGFLVSDPEEIFGLDHLMEHSRKDMVLVKMKINKVHLRESKNDKPSFVRGNTINLKPLLTFRFDSIYNVVKNRIAGIASMF